jgi:hypothetical protein
VKQITTQKGPWKFLGNFFFCVFVSVLGNDFMWGNVLPLANLYLNVYYN